METEKRTQEQKLTKEETIALRNRHIGSSCKLWYRNKPVKIIEAKNQYMYDEQGRQFLDCINNVAHVGHCHPRVVEAGTRQMSVLNTNSRFLHDNLVLLARRLAKTSPGDLSVCFLVNSGSEANDLALRLARAHTKGREVIVLDHAYHGHTVAVMDLSPYKDPQGASKPDWVHVAPCPDQYAGKYTDVTHPGEDLGKVYADDVKKITDRLQREGKSLAAFFAESLQSCGGQIIPPPGYLSAVYKHVREAGGICVADEVQVGFGRVGKHWWAYELQGVTPDIVTIGKPMGNGHPVAAVLTTPAVAASFANTGVEYFNTYGGNPVSCSIAMAVLDVIEDERLRENATDVGGYLVTKLETLKEKHDIIGNVKGVGLFVGVDLVKNRQTREPATAVAQHLSTRLRDLQVFLSTDGPNRNVLKFKPPMCFSRENVDEVVDKLDKILEEIGDIHSFKADMVSTDVANGKAGHSVDSDDRATTSSNGDLNGHSHHVQQGSSDTGPAAKRPRK